MTRIRIFDDDAQKDQESITLIAVLQNIPISPEPYFNKRPLTNILNKKLFIVTTFSFSIRISFMHINGKVNSIKLNYQLNRLTKSEREIE